MIKTIIQRSGSLLVALVLVSGATPALAQNGTDDAIVTVTQVDTSNFPEVSVWVSVTDQQGNPINMVDKSAFTITENGTPVEINEVFQAGEQGPITTVLTIDRSGSMERSGKLEAAKAAANTFINLMQADDMAGVIVFNIQVETVQGLTSDKDALHNAINSITAFEDTALYDGLQASMDLLSGVPGRKVIVILSDGLDNSSTQSSSTILDGIEQAEVSVYPIGLGDPSIGTEAMAGIDESTLKSIAERSHGIYTYAPDPTGLQALYEQISFRLHNEYRLTYTAPNALHDGVRRGLEVKIAQTGSVQTNYNPGGVIPETATALEWPVFGGLVVALLALVALPDVIRSIGGVAHGKRLFKKSRVRLTGQDKNTGKKPAPRTSRVKVNSSKSG